MSPASSHSQLLKDPVVDDQTLIWLVTRNTSDFKPCHWFTSV